MKELPVACSLGAEELADRADRWRRLAERELISALQTERGALQRYRRDDRVERELRELIALEGECCPFLDFRLEPGPDELVLDVTGPMEARELVASFASPQAAGN